MQSVYSLTGKIALITGGSRGIGLGIAREFINLGARVAITGLSQDALDEAKDTLGEHCFPYVNDVTEKQRHPEFIATIAREIGPLDVLVNNAGRHCKKPSLDCSNEEFAAVIDTNLTSIFSLIKAVLPSMMARKRGSIINISSMAALFGLPQVTAYSSSKTALLGMTRTLASEYSSSGVRFNCIAPGFIESRMSRAVMEEDPAREARILQRTPMHRFGKPEEIGHAAAFLASDASTFVTGICLPVDGGAAIGF